MLRYLLLFSIFLFSIKAENISNLLQKLNETKELYHKTKTESAGLIIVYSRYDLDRMQAYKLVDILKSLRFFTYKEGYTGSSALSPSGGSSILSSAFRLYIDDHEVSSAIYGSAMLQYAQMDLGFVDHIEIYEGGNAIAFGDEPGLTTIRIYSKKPSKEKGTSLSILGDSRGSLEGKICYTKLFDDGSSLLAFLSKGDTKREHIYKNGSNYSKDSNGHDIYIKYSYKDKANFTAGSFQLDKDAFVGVGMSHTPLSPNEIDRYSSFANLTLNLPYHFKLDASIDKMSHQMLFSDKNGIFIVQNPTLFYKFDAKFDEDIYKIKLMQNLKSKKSDFKWGIENIIKRYSISHMYMDNTAFTNPTGPSRLNISSIFGEESYNFDKNNLIIATLKVDRYTNNYNDKKSNELIARVGYIHLFSKNLTLKTFLTKTYLYPGFAYTSSFPNIYLNNPNLEASTFKYIINELKYKDTTNEWKLGLLFMRNSHVIVYDPITKMFINQDKDTDVIKGFFDYTYNFNPQNKLSIGFYDTHFCEDISPKSPLRGGYIRVLNSFGRFDIYNELTYRSSYTYPLPSSLGGDIDIKDGFGYDLGIKWHINHAMTLGLKGENILGKASKTPIYGLGGVDAIDKKVIMQLEYFF